MAGITDSAFRQVCRKCDADAVYSEMASVSALFFKPEKTLELVKFNKVERPYVVQLFGKEPEHFAKAAEIITKKVKPDGIDINFGCPAKKVFGHGSGCALMPQKKLARDIIKAVCDNTPLPVSLKIRAGLKDMSALNFIENVKDLPFTAVMVHGRTYEGGFGGVVDFKIAEEIKKIIPNKIVLANGGITSPEQAVKILKDYPLLDGLGIARGALGRPWIFEEIKELLKICHCERSEAIPEFNTLNTGLPRRYASRNDNNCNFSKIKKLAIHHAQILYKEKGQLGLFEIRKHLAWYVRGFPNAAELRRKLVQVKSIAEIKNILK